MLTWEQEKQAIDDAISRFPKYFVLRDGKTVRISASDSFFSGPTLYLYVETEIDGKWYAYAKGTEQELKAAINWNWKSTK